MRAREKVAPAGGRGARWRKEHKERAGREQGVESSDCEAGLGSAGFNLGSGGVGKKAEEGEVCGT